jgi:class 3 adenylate cyclase
MCRKSHIQWVIHSCEEEHIYLAMTAIKAASETFINSDDLERESFKICVICYTGGPLVSNVTGSLNPQYGLFGDTVNVAACMKHLREWKDCSLLQ